MKLSKYIWPFPYLYHWIMYWYYEWRFYQDVKLYRRHFGDDSVQVAGRSNKEMVEDLKKECKQQGKNIHVS